MQPKKYSSYAEIEHDLEILKLEKEIYFQKMKLSYEKTKESVFSKITRAVAGKSKVDDEVLDNLEEVLITSDVGVETTLRIIERIESRVSRDKYVNTSELNVILKETQV